MEQFNIKVVGKIDLPVQQKAVKRAPFGISDEDLYAPTLDDLFPQNCTPHHDGDYGEDSVPWRIPIV